MHSKLSRQKVIVTGGNGFIGSHLVKRLIHIGADTYVFVRGKSDLWRLKECIEDITLLKGDLRNESFVKYSFSKIKPDLIFHIAAYGVDARNKDYKIAAESNIIGAINLLNASIKVNCGRIISTGTSMQYGNKEGLIDEESLLTPNNIYGSTKAAATIISHQIASENDIDIITLIPFGVFGEAEGSHKFFPHIILSVLRNMDVKLTLCEQYRDYCYIENIIDGYIMAAESTSIKNEIFNIGSGQINQLRYYVDMIFSNIDTDRKPDYGALPYRKNDLWKPQPDVKKIGNELGWEPKIALQDGIKKTVEWFRENSKEYEKKGR